jgi:predicted ribosomally synthesized peptide with SipW-like signal peptide
MRRSSTKSALFTSFMAVVLCCAMLLGTTFAWFTDTVTTTNNIIQSGALDVEFKYYDVKEKEYKKIDTKLVGKYCPLLGGI